MMFDLIVIISVTG